MGAVDSHRSGIRSLGRVTGNESLIPLFLDAFGGGNAQLSAIAGSRAKEDMDISETSAIVYCSKLNFLAGRYILAGLMLPHVKGLFVI